MKYFGSNPCYDLGLGRSLRSPTAWNMTTVYAYLVAKEPHWMAIRMNMEILFYLFKFTTMYLTKIKFSRGSVTL